MEKRVQMVVDGMTGVEDRSIYSDSIFASMYKELGYLSREEYSVYQSLLGNMLVE